MRTCLRCLRTGLEHRFENQSFGNKMCSLLAFEVQAPYFSQMTLKSTFQEKYLISSKMINGDQGSILIESCCCLPPPFRFSPKYLRETSSSCRLVAKANEIEPHSTVAILRELLFTMAVTMEVRHFLATHVMLHSLAD